MAQATILVVEDETIVAKDLQCTLVRLGYKVPATATSGEEAVRKAEEIQPDLVLMDIVLKGPMDGVETARKLHARVDVPVVYLTAYADDHTLQRVKETAPAGYLLKPFQPSELRPTIEMALHRASLERQVRESLCWLATTVRCVEDGVVTTNGDGRVTYLNPAAETLTGWDSQEAIGQALDTVLPRDERKPSGPEPEDVIQVSRIIPFVHHTLVARDGGRRQVRGRSAPVVSEQGKIIGSVVVFRAMAEKDRKHALPVPLEPGERGWEKPYANGVINLCAWCKRVPDGSGDWYDLHTFITERSGLDFNGGLCPDCMERCFPRDETPPCSLG